MMEGRGMSNRRRWTLAGRAAGELLLVVVGILLAFQFEGWRAARQLADEEERVLRSIDADLEQTLARIEDVRGSQSRALEAKRTLLAMALGERSVAAPDSFAILVTWAGTWWRLEPVTETYDALVGAGELDLIQDRELRGELAAFASDLAFGFEDEVETQALLMEMSRRESRLGLVPVSLRIQGIGAPAPDDLSGLPDLLEDPEYLYFLGRHASLEFRRLEYYDGIEASAIRIREMLAAPAGS